MRTILFILISFVAITATLSGLVMMSNPDGSLLNLSLSLLDGTPFRDYQVPGIILASVVGGVNLLAAVYNLSRHPARYNWAMAGGFVICGWILAQFILIQAAHWLQYLYLGTGILTILLSYQLKGKWAA